MEGINLLITRETDYAMRILRALSSGEQITAGEICRRELLPQQFVYKILKKLEKASFVHITRGTEGGCRLSVDLKTVTLYDLTVIMDASKLVSACMHPDFQCAWRQKHALPCSVHKRLSQVQSVLDQELKSHNLYQMLVEID
jgi:Rrf2 family protein